MEVTIKLNLWKRLTHSLVMLHVIVTSQNNAVVEAYRETKKFNSFKMALNTCALEI